MGVTPEYAAYLDSPAWKAKRAFVLNRDRNRCRKCGATDFLVVHHLTYKRIFNEAAEDLITLCRRCHDKTHSYGDYLNGIIRPKRKVTSMKQRKAIQREAKERAKAIKAAKKQARREAFHGWQEADILRSALGE